MKKQKDFRKLNFNDLLDFIDGERYQSRISLYEIYFKNIDERVEARVCIRGCYLKEIRGFGSSQQYILEYGVNSSGFREGDTVFLNKPTTQNEHLARGFQMSWIDSDPIKKEIVLEVSYDMREIPFPFNTGEEIIIDQSTSGLLDTVERLISKIRDDEENRDNFYTNFLDGSLKNEEVVIDERLRSKIRKKLTLTETQHKAFELSVSNYPVVGIQGPPGTGKTYVLSAIACYYLKKGYNVFISALSHFAINNALNRITETIELLGLDCEAIKVSRNKNKGLDEKVRIIKSIREIQDKFPTMANAYGMTAFKAPFEQRYFGRFDLLIMDEASQLTVTNAFMSMSYARKIILIGDHMQMNPIITYNHHKNPALYYSVFEYFNKLYPERTVMLTDTFRMNKDLTKLPSKLFYHDRLEPFGETAQKKLKLNIKKSADPKKLKYWDILDPDMPMVFVEFSHRYCTKGSDEEAQFISDLIMTAIKDYGISAKKIAVLVPFRAQQENIRVALRKLSRRDHKRYTSCILDTVERMQGQERDMIIYSLTMSDLGKLSQINEFFFNIYRFNVAITRSKVKRIIVGSRNLLKTRVSDPEILKNINIFAEFMEKANTVKIDGFVKSPI